MRNGPTLASRPAASLGRLLLTLLVIAALAAVPLVLSSFYVFVATRVLILALFAMAYDVVFGYGGMPSLGHAAFFGLGAYALGLGVSRWEWGFVQVVVVAFLAGAVLGLVTGILTVRTRGMHLLLLTLALAQALWGLAFQQVSFTKGDNGISGITRETVPLSAVDTTSFYLFVAAIAVLAYLLLRRYLHSVMGRVLQGVRESETRMAALGFRVSVYRVAAFMVSGSLSAIAGVLSVYLVGFVGPDVLNWPLSAEVLLVSILGGAGTLIGPALGSTFLVTFETLVSARSQRWMLMLGVTYMVVGLVLPGGLMGLAKRLNARWRPRRSEEPVTDTAVDSIAGIAASDSLPSSPEVFSNGLVTGMSPALPVAPALEARSLSRYFDGLAALEDVSLTVAKGERRVIIGPNGAGKSTFFNIVSGQQSPTQGRVLLFGEDVTHTRPFVRARLGVGRTIQIPDLLTWLTLFENAKLAVTADRGPRFGMWRDLDAHHEVVEASRELLTTWGLWWERNRVVAELPYGLQRILEIVLALAGEPRLLLLDEPTAGLAAAEAAVVVDLIKQFSRDLTIVMIEHDMDVAFAIADSVTVLVDGAILATGIPRKHPRQERGTGRLHGGAIRMNALLEVRDVHTFYGLSHVLHGVSLQAREGQVVAVLGRNGMGKTTLVHTITGLIPHHRGAVYYDGEAIGNLAPWRIAAKGVGLAPQGHRVFPSLSVAENLEVAVAKPASGPPWTVDRVRQAFPILDTRWRQRAATCPEASSRFSPSPGPCSAALGCS